MQQNLSKESIFILTSIIQKISLIFSPSVVKIFSFHHDNYSAICWNCRDDSNIIISRWTVLIIDFHTYVHTFLTPFWTIGKNNTYISHTFHGRQNRRLRGMLWCPKVRHVWDIVGLGIFCDVCSGGSRWINFSCSGGPWCWDDVPEMNIILIIDNYVTIFHISLRLSPTYHLSHSCLSLFFWYA